MYYSYSQDIVYCEYAFKR